MPEPKFFKTQAELRNWFLKNHDKLQEQWIGFHKVGSDKKSVTYAQALDEALCFGWIDGIRKSINSESYMIRYTPRRPKSIWSAVNIKRTKELTKAGTMHPAGLKTFNERDVKKTNMYSFERKAAALGGEYEKAFKKNKKAWEFFLSQPPWYRRTSVHWVISAKQEETQLRRLETLIKDSGGGRRIKELSRNK
jgi:uncharacterized protein YdeI (YjbR/CyaY-like superfamily)